MRSIIIAFDLDGTVMHSRNRYAPGDTCVERIDGIDRGFMSSVVVEAFRDVAAKAILIPVTSRSVSQYERIVWPSGIMPRQAYVANGAVMLRAAPGGGFRKTYTIDVQAEDYIDGLLSALASLKHDLRFRDSRIVDNSYAMAILKRGHEDDDLGNLHFDRERLWEHREQKKFYLFPKECNKGKAIDLIRSDYPESLFVCAGDSKSDLHMGVLADEAIFPTYYGDYGRCGESSKSEGLSFEETVSRKVLDYVSQHIDPKTAISQLDNRRSVFSLGRMKATKSL